MLRGISPVITPDLLRELAAMGHGDALLLADAHYPHFGSAERVLRADGVGIPELLTGVLELMPLDQYADWQYGLMSPVGDDPEAKIWKTYAALIDTYHPGATAKHFDRFDFYKEAASGHVTVITGETAQYGNIILPKGVVL